MDPRINGGQFLHPTKLLACRPLHIPTDGYRVCNGLIKVHRSWTDACVHPQIMNWLNIRLKNTETITDLVRRPLMACHLFEWEWTFWLRFSAWTTYGECTQCVFSVNHTLYTQTCIRLCQVAISSLWSLLIFRPRSWLSYFSQLNWRDYHSSVCWALCFYTSLPLIFCREFLSFHSRCTHKANF